MSARVAVLVFPGSNSEEETMRACLAAGLETRLVHWSDRGHSLGGYDAYVLPGGFAHEDRIRAGAVAAHDAMMDAVILGTQRGKLVLGICNGAQILLEAGLVPGTGPPRRPQAAFAPNLPSGKFRCVHVHVKLRSRPSRCAITAALPEGTLLPMWVAHREGRLAASPHVLSEIEGGAHVTFVYARADGSVAPDAVPNGSALGAAALTNKGGNVLAIMPHAERDCWTYQHRDGAVRAAARGRAEAMLAPSGGFALFRSFAAALG